MSVLDRQLATLVAGRSLTAEDTAKMVGLIMDGDVQMEYAAAWLTALASKGEEVDEVVGAAGAMRARSLRVLHDCRIVLDVCGTGGDGLHTINISTAVAFVVAACDLPVAKHGNRASSSKCGSADVLEALGVRIDRSPEEARRQLEERGVAFLFAQAYHPAMREVAALRKRLGIRTIFNMLGPLTNPARATHQLIGVSRPGTLEMMALAAVKLGVKAGAVVHASNGLDEVAGDVPTTVVRFKGNSLEHFTIDPTQYGVHATLDDIRGGDAEYNARALRAILEGEDSPRADVVALNAAVALYITDLAPDLHAALHRTHEVLRNGQALAQLVRLQEPERERV
jgi:anthranilate phosphoribosyltransferase